MGNWHAAGAEIARFVCHAQAPWQRRLRWLSISLVTPQVT